MRLTATITEIKKLKKGFHWVYIRIINTIVREIRMRIFISYGNKWNHFAGHQQQVNIDYKKKKKLTN